MDFGIAHECFKDKDTEDVIFIQVPTNTEATVKEVCDRRVRPFFHPGRIRLFDEEGKWVADNLLWKNVTWGMVNTISITRDAFEEEKCFAAADAFLAKMYPLPIERGRRAFDRMEYRITFPNRAMHEQFLLRDFPDRITTHHGTLKVRVVKPKRRWFERI